MIDPLENADEFIKQLEEDAKSSSEENVVSNAEQDGEEKDQDNKDISDYHGDDLNASDKADAESDDAKKRARAFAKQRNEAKQYKEQLEAEREERQKLAERLARLEGRSEATIQPKHENLAEQEPDRDLYPDDHRDWKMRQLEKKLEENEKFRHHVEQQTQYQRERDGVTALENQFKAQAPDYLDAVDFLIARERETKKLLNPKMSESEVDSQIQLEKVALFKHLLANGQNPTEVIYNIAKRDGYAPKKLNDGKNRSNLERVAENQRRSSSLIGGSSASDASGKMTSEQVLNKSMDELMRMSDSDWSKVESSSR